MAFPSPLPPWLTSSVTLDTLVASQNTYAGRDKITRTLAFWCSLQAQKSKSHAAQWTALAKQCSTARLVFRQFNHFNMLKALQGLLLKPPEDRVERMCSWTTTTAYTIFGWFELAAWLADAKLIIADSVKLFRYCLYLWFIALVPSIVKQVRVLSRKGFSSLDKVKDDILLLISYTCDLLCAGNSMPSGVFWSGKFSPSVTVRLSLLASLIGFYRTL